MFWGIVLKPGKKYTQTVKKSFHLSSASLDVTGCGDEPIQLFITTDVKILLCTLRKNKTEQVALDLNFSEEESISFHSQGNGSVHLCGYFLEDEDDFGDFNGLGDEIDDSEDEEVPQLVDSSKPKNKANKDNAKKLQELEKKLAQKGNDDEDEDDDDDEEMDEEDDEDDDDDEEGEEEGEESDEDDEEEEEDEDEDEEVEEPKPKQMKIEKPKQNGVDVKNKQEKKKDDKAQDTKKSGGEKSLAGGVKVEDIVTGKGDEAKSGKRVQVYYEGRLKSNNKMFDSTKTGNGFKFKLGQGEVIKGWDVGVSGMKVGGKRRITVPPHMGYGARGSPPVIPPNSTLVFEVELKRVL